MRVNERALAVCVTLCLLGSAPNVAAAVIDSATFGGHQYYLIDPLSWLDAEAEAVALGGHLVTIGTTSPRASTSTASWR